MLPAGKHVLSVYGDVLAAAKPGTLFIDCSTIDVASARSAHALAAERKHAVARCAGVGRRRRRRGGDLDVHGRRHRGGLRQGRSPIIEAMAQARRALRRRRRRPGREDLQQHDPRHLDDRGAEAFVLAEKLGLDHQALFDVASTSSGQCWSLTSYCPVPGPVPTSPANNGYKPGFASALMLKDLMLAQEAAQASGATTPLGAAAAQLYGMHNAWGEGGSDFSGIVNLLRGKVTDRPAALTPRAK